MKKKLVKHGNSVALIIDKALLKLLKWDESTIVTITIQDNCLLVTPTKKKQKVLPKKLKLAAISRCKKYMKRLLKSMNRYLKS